MNTLQQLNTLGNTPFEYTDNRPAGVIFDRVTPTNQEVTTSQNTTHSLPVGIEIEEVINYASAAVSYKVNVSAVSGATVTWPTVPSGCTVTNPSTGVYIISGINTAATWDIVRSPTVLSPSGFNNDFWQYSATITYNSTSTKVWYVGVYVGTVTVLTTPSAYVYTAASSNSVTGYPQIQYPGSAPTWTVTVTPELIDAVTTLSSAGAGGTSTFNSTTKVLTLVGTKTQVNSHLAALSVTTVANKQWSYNLTYVATNSTDIATATKTQAWSNTDYAILSVTRGNETYLVNTNANINNGPLVASTAAGTFSLDIVPTDTAGVSLLTTATGETIFRSPSNSSPNSFNFGYSISSSSTYDYFVIGCPGLTVNDGCVYVYKNGNIMARIPAPAAASWFGSGVVINDNADTIAISGNDVYVYTRINAVWTLQASLGFSGLGDVLDLSSDGNILVAGNPGNDQVTVWRRDGTTWQVSAGVEPVNIDYPSGYAGYRFGASVSISLDGTYMAVGAPNDNTASGTYGTTGNVFVYRKTGSTWATRVLEATLTPSDTQINQAFGFSVSLDSNGDTLVIGAPTTAIISGTSNKAATYVFTRSGTTWTEQTRLVKDVFTNFRFGYAVDVSSDGTYLVSSNPGNNGNRGEVYKYQYTSSWGLVNTYTSSTANQLFGNDCALGYSNRTYIGTDITSGSDYAYVYTGATAATYSPPTYSTQADDQYGYASALNGDGTYLAISKQGKDVNGVYNTGSVYIYTRIGNTWTLQTEIYPTDLIISGDFGKSLSFSDDATYLAIGASTSEPNGVAYVFTRSGSTWTQQAKISGASEGDFGNSVSINSDGTYLAVGWYNDGGSDTGSVIIYTRAGSTWTQQQKLVASSPISYQRFGNSVSINSDATYIAIGAYGQSGFVGSDTGSVYVFTRSGSTWTQQTRLQASDAAALDYFGTSVSINSDATYIAVGSEYDDNSAGTNAGSAYIFTRSGSTWTEQTRLQASDGAVNEIFGNNVSLNGRADILVVTSWTNIPDKPNDPGSAYVFTRSGTTWTQRRKLTASDAQSSDQFGSSVALSTDGATIIVGAYLEDTGGSAAGSAYGYFVSDLFETWNDTTKTLTITGTQDFINTSIDLITLEPGVGYDKNYQLLYTVITPSATTASRSQRITRA